MMMMMTGAEARTGGWKLKEIEMGSVGWCGKAD
jgi:hypothetical protein